MKVMFVGDVSLGEYYLSFGHGPRTFLETDNVFMEVQKIFDEADFVVGNLETSITTFNIDNSCPESMVLRGKPEHNLVLKNAGFRILQLANNHTVQHGQAGFEETVSLLKRLNIEPIGLKNQNVVIIEVDGIKIGFLAASDVPDNTYNNQQCYQHLDEKFLEKIQKECNCVDHLIVMLHWGLEASTTPLDYQKEIAYKLYKAGVSAIVGNHPHLCYEIVRKDNFVVAYSLGNFVFDLCWDKRMLNTGILSIEFDKNTITNLLFYPVIIEKNGCLPTPTSIAPIEIKSNYFPYNFGSVMGLQQLKKTQYLIRNIFRGNTFLKLKYLKNKILGYRSKRRMPIEHS